ncbi:SDR family oxidoreductase [Labedella endophytica]|uniref:SDR family NAD(P)-dependent oxidoreductase n=1 Tax=Labedella endophytica TaxID=1523160 RepID=A0A3S0XKN0_9MICO|nr:SDR family oxidoreductase [Labedella endophytica]RUQ98174.1 SDR family NAD(P)-dependent oxidoreductase [Labedella endophytica]
MQIKDSVVLVTGANRGIGAEFVRQLKERGAAKIYATARDAASITADGVEAVALDVTDEGQVRAIAERATDVTILINNAGVSLGADLIGGDMDTIRRELETNAFGPLNTTRAFAPVLAANGGGAILNVLSAIAWFAAPGATSYGMSKAAAFSLTEGTRALLARQGTQVAGLLMALIDTDMAAGMDAPKTAPETLVATALDGLEAGAIEILGDAMTVQLKAHMHLDPAERYAMFAG